jgi:hypothetical protein
LLPNIKYFSFSYRLQQVEGVLEQKKLLHILQDPTRIFSSDKLSFQFFPKTRKVLVCKGDKNVYEVDRGLARVSITAMFAFSGSGVVCPPMLMYPYKRIPSENTQRVPDEWRMIIMYQMFEEIVGSQLIT